MSKIKSNPRVNLESKGLRKKKKRMGKETEAKEVKEVKRLITYRSASTSDFSRNIHVTA